jgi:hypothetical protein
MTTVIPRRANWRACGREFATKLTLVNFALNERTQNLEVYWHEIPGSRLRAPRDDKH